VAAAMKKVVECKLDWVYKVSEQADNFAALLLGFGKLLCLLASSTDR
jgi:hypothetical protein